MSEAQKGNTVKVHYTGKLSDGTVFDTSVEREPLEFVLGEGKVIPGFESGVEGMKTGESKTITIPSDQAYGPRQEQLVAEVKKDQFPPDLNPQMGQQLQLQQENGQVVVVTVTDINENQVTLDANHPLAGKGLIFDVELVEIA
jgi:peptidylprolyl isomerase